MNKLFTISKGGFYGQVEVVDGELTDFYVHPLVRRKGWGRRLITRAVKWADNNRIPLRLRVCPHGSYRKMSFNRLVEFYKEFGFKRVNKFYLLRKV